MNPVAILRKHLSESAAFCRLARFFGAEFEFNVGAELLNDVAENEAKAARLAHKDEIAAIEASRKLDAILADGRIDAEEIKELRGLRGTFRAIATRAHDETEILLA